MRYQTQYKQLTFVLHEIRGCAKPTRSPTIETLVICACRQQMLLKRDAIWSRRALRTVMHCDG